MRHFYQIEYLSVLLKYSVFCQHFEIREILASYCGKVNKWKNLTFLTGIYEQSNDVWRFCMNRRLDLQRFEIAMSFLLSYFFWFNVLACLFTYTLVQVCRWELTPFRAFCQLADMLVPIFLLISAINFYSWKYKPFCLSSRPSIKIRIGVKKLNCR